ncbi:hypothetical protein [Streptomyces sp. NPDC051183]|uniref:hypothetical protein n=1 Tax=unclassified Streptomyces TaxID=2593676 RepID=UPI003428A097
MTRTRAYFAVGVLSALALAMSSGWGQDWPDSDWPAGFSITAENVQHADTTPTLQGDGVWL